MATLDITQAKIRLSRKEQEHSDKALRSLLVGLHQQQQTELSQVQESRQKANRALNEQAWKVGLITPEMELAHKEKLQKFVERGKVDYKKFQAFEAKAKKVKPAEAPHTIWGLASGVERPPFDHQFIFTPSTRGVNDTGGYTAAFATRATGAMSVGYSGSNGQPSPQANTAGVGWWYVPNRNGMLHLLASPSVSGRATTIPFAWWNALLIGRVMTIVGVYNRSPYRFDHWDGFTVSPLFNFNDSWWSGRDVTFESRQMRVSTSVPIDTDHYYACFLWVDIQASTNDHSMVSGNIAAELPSMTFWTT